MIEFKNKELIKLTRNKGYASHAEPLLLPNEIIIDSFSTIRDGVVFTNKRIIAIDIQGVGKKTDYTSIPYKMISMFSVETAGVLDVDSTLSISVLGVGSMKFEFLGSSKVKEISQYIAQLNLG